MNTAPILQTSIAAGDRVRVSHRRFGYPVQYEAEVTEARPSGHGEGHWYLVVGPHRDSAGLAHLEAVAQTNACRVEVI